MPDVSIEILKYINYTDGAYIECGANDGIRQSNTYYLEKHLNWGGILIEPSKVAFDSCVKNRNPIRNIFLNCALVASDETKKVWGDFDGNLMASVGGKRKNSIFLQGAEARTLTSIIDEYEKKDIDFFSIDVEGYEYEVLCGLDFKKYRPKYILIEIYDQQKSLILDFMERADYDLVCNLSNFNLIEYPQWDGTHNDYLFKGRWLK